MTVSFGHFVDHLGNKGVPREQAEQVLCTIMCVLVHVLLVYL